MVFKISPNTRVSLYGMSIVHTDFYTSGLTYSGPPASWKPTTWEIPLSQDLNLRPQDLRLLSITPMPWIRRPITIRYIYQLDP